MNTRHPGGAIDGFTLIELLVAATIFVVLLGALTSLFVSSSRAYRVTQERSEAIQDAEAVLQLLRYEFALAGYRGLGADSGTAAESLVIDRVGDSHVITIRYIEDTYVQGGSAERVVTFSVDPASRELIRSEPDTVDQAMVGNVAHLEVLGYIRRDRQTVPLTDPDLCGGPCEVPQALAGLLLRVGFADGSEWQFPVGLYNPQTIGGSAA